MPANSAQRLGQCGGWKCARQFAVITPRNGLRRNQDAGATFSVDQDYKFAKRAATSSVSVSARRICFEFPGGGVKLTLINGWPNEFEHKHIFQSIRRIRRGG
jgi:hypothetical protein